MQNAFSLKHLYEATQGQLLCGHVGTAYVFSSPDTEQDHSFSNVGLALLTDQQEDLTPFRRFPVHLYEQPDGRHIFDAGKAQHLTTKPAGKHHRLLSTSCAFDITCTLSAPKSCLFCWGLMHSNLHVLMNVSKHLWQAAWYAWLMSGLSHKLSTAHLPHGMQAQKNFGSSAHQAMVNLGCIHVRTVSVTVASPDQPSFLCMPQQLTLSSLARSLGCLQFTYTSRQ